MFNGAIKLILFENWVWCFIPCTNRYNVNIVIYVYITCDAKANDYRIL